MRFFLFFASLLYVASSMAQTGSFHSSFRDTDIEACLEVKEMLNKYNEYSSRKEYHKIFNDILEVVGLKPNFYLAECSNINNAVAYPRNVGINQYERYILYDPVWMEEVENKSNSWAKVGIIAHEIGHHLNDHMLSKHTGKAQMRQEELEADEFAGFVLNKLGASLEESQLFTDILNTEADDTFRTHPKKSLRLQAIKKGWNNAQNLTPASDERVNEDNYTIEFDSNELETPTESKLDLESPLGNIAYVYTGWERAKDMGNELSARKKYNNRTIVVSGLVSSVRETILYPNNETILQVTIYGDPKNFEVQSIVPLRSQAICHFSTFYGKKLSAFKEGDPLKIKGVAKITNGRFELFDCELVQ